MKAVGPFQSHNNLNIRCPYFKYKSSILNQTQQFYDSVSSISCAQSYAHKDIIALTSWDASVRVCTISDKDSVFKKGDKLLQQVYFGKASAPVNQSCFNREGSKLYFSDIFGQISCLDLVKMKKQTILQPSNNALSCLSIDQNEKFLITHTNSLSNKIMHFNIGKKLSQSEKLQYSHSYSGTYNYRFAKYHEYNNSKHIIALSSINFVDIYPLSGNGIWLGNDNPKIEQGAFIKHVPQTNMPFKNSVCIKGNLMSHPQAATCLSVSKDLKHIAIGKTEGFIGFANIVKSISGDYSFVIITFMFFQQNQNIWWSNKKLDKTSSIEDNTYHPANCIEHHPIREKYIAVGLGDGYIKFYDAKQKKETRSIYYGQVPVTTIKFTKNGKYLVCAVGDDWQSGPKFNPIFYPLVQAIPIKQDEKVKDGKLNKMLELKRKV